MASAKITQFIGSHEGKVLTWYLDPTHTPTIGYGFTWGSKVFQEWWMGRYGRKMRKGDTITEQDALAVLKLMIESEYAPPVDKKFPGVKINIREAAYSFVYNAGAGALKWKWAAAVARGDIRGAAALWRTTATTSKGKKLPGLVRRRAEEADIAEFNKWPAWLKVETTMTPPESKVYVEDIKQAQQWLKDLGYYKGDIDGIAGGKTQLAARSFQQDHGTLKVDGIIGPATLSALQRAIDLRKKATNVIVGGGATSTAGGADTVTGASDAVLPQATGFEAPWLSDLLLWGGIAIVIVGIIWLAWRYQDEINALVRKL